MDTNSPPLSAHSTSDADPRSLVDEVKLLVEDGKTYLEAELQFQKSRAGVVGTGARRAATLGAFALAFVLLALLALTVGLLLALAPLLGAWGAMAAVVLGLLLCAALCGWAARGAWQSAARQLASQPRAAPDA